MRGKGTLQMVKTLQVMCDMNHLKWLGCLGWGVLQYPKTVGAGFANRRFTVVVSYLLMIESYLFYLVLNLKKKPLKRYIKFIKSKTHAIEDFPHRSEVSAVGFSAQWSGVDNALRLLQYYNRSDAWQHGKLLQRISVERASRRSIKFTKKTMCLLILRNC